MAVAFFDIGDTLATPRFTPTGTLLGFTPLPGVLETLSRLQSRALRMGVISETDESARSMQLHLERAGLAHFFEPELLLYSSVESLGKDSPEIFWRAMGRAGVAETSIFVGEEADERAFAAEAGMLVAPHPLLVFDVLEGRPLRFLRIGVPNMATDGDWRAVLRAHALVPVSVTEAAGRMLYAIGSNATAATLDDLGFAVDRLGAIDAPRLTSLYLLRDDRQARTGFLDPGGWSREFFANDATAFLVLSSSPNGLVVALPAGRVVDDFHFSESQHGHTEKLLPDLSLLQPYSMSEPGARRAGWLEVATFAEPVLTANERDVLKRITPDRLASLLGPYVGQTPLGDDSDEPVQSRHIHHADNARVAKALARDLDRIGGGLLQVGLMRFGQDGRHLENVEAELGGIGADGFVLVTAHLDSTAASDATFVPLSDRAPGADDDGSGVAAVLAIAEACVEMARVRRPARAIRFVLFNAEEQGLAGSKAYARAAAASGAPIVAVYQMDMIGFRAGPDDGPRPFEVHVGFLQSADVQARSLALAERIVRLTAIVSPGLSPPQIYADSDPAAGRSDHASFQERGYAACVVSEDFFVDPGGAAPVPQPNPDYHRRSDLRIDVAYAADIARVVAAAAWTTANA